jgi:hypothetical protein
MAALVAKRRFKKLVGWHRRRYNFSASRRHFGFK